MESEPLCCCEYVDNSNQINHILACCCNCDDLDSGFESFVTGHGFPDQNRSKLMATIHDRMRIPWIGGAKQVAFDSILPVIMLPVMILLAANSLWWTVFSFTAVFVILISVFRFFIRTLPKTKFFLVWTITSIVVLYVIFELIVIPLLEILLLENIVVSVIFACFLLCFHKVRVKNGGLEKTPEDGVEKGMGGAHNRCSICQIWVPGKDHHCVWFDTCVGSHNQCLFILSLFSAIICLTYSANLTLTSVCHPTLFLETILLPDDCSQVYEQYDLGLSFVAALYSLTLAAILSLFFLHQLLLVSIGLTTKEWRSLSLCGKCFLGVFSKRTNSLGFVRNWSRVICWNQTYRNRLH